MKVKQTISYVAKRLSRELNLIKIAEFSLLEEKKTYVSGMFNLAS